MSALDAEQRLRQALEHHRFDRNHHALVSMVDVRDLLVRLDATRCVTAERVAELRHVKGPCANTRCSMYYGHRGPCDIQTSRVLPGGVASGFGRRR